VFARSSLSIIFHSQRRNESRQCSIRGCMQNCGTTFDNIRVFWTIRDYEYAESRSLLSSSDVWFSSLLPSHLTQPWDHVSVKEFWAIADPVIGTAHIVRLSHQRFLNYHFLLAVQFFVNHSLEMGFQFLSSWCFSLMHNRLCMVGRLD